MMKYINTSFTQNHLLSRPGYVFLIKPIFPVCRLLKTQKDIYFDYLIKITVNFKQEKLKSYLKKMRNAYLKQRRQRQ